MLIKNSSDEAHQSSPLIVLQYLFIIYNTTAAKVGALCKIITIKMIHAEYCVIENAILHRGSTSFFFID